MRLGFTTPFNSLFKPLGARDLQGLVHPKMSILSIITHPCFAPNHMTFVYSATNHYTTISSLPHYSPMLLLTQVIKVSLLNLYYLSGL